jgi:alanyl-tRNA synthetase
MPRCWFKFNKIFAKQNNPCFNFLTYVVTRPKSMKSATDIRDTFLSFFVQKAHHLVPSAPIVVKNDPTLMFTNAGMNPFKDIFLGLKSPNAKRVTDTQKCLRVSGKHNDLDEVGHDTYHHTMFEMLGNWSFGDYYKVETIAWAWELLTVHYGLNPGQLYATVFGGDTDDALPTDEDARAEWRKWLPEERILSGNKKDNFWEMGETRPCGPSSEIHIDLRSESDRAQTPGKDLVNADHPEVVEIWNLVFIQYNRKADGKLVELPAKHVDTGMGFERLVMALQNKRSTYDTDLFDGLRHFVQKKAGIQYETAPEPQRIAIRVVIDHIRAIVFTIGDGQLPSNTGAGYVIRRILRRAARYAFSYLNQTEPFMHEMVALMAQQYREVFPEVAAQQAFITRIVLEEEKSFLRKLESGSQMFEAYLTEHRSAKEVSGDFAFKLYDTFGFPVDLTQLMAREQGRSVDMEGFEAALQAQKARSRQASNLSAGDWVVVTPSQDLPTFRGYDTLALDTRILQYRTVEAKKEKRYQVVLEETPFYAEMGGQIGDRGTLTQGDETIRVLDTQKENELIVHQVDKLPQEAEGTWTAQVEAGFRKQIEINHSATHLLHAALREVLGTHVEQRGSLVSDKALRFDFSHFAKVSDEELAEVERMVNERVTAAIPLIEYREMPIDAAKRMGATALFGEKYGDLVRVVIFDQAFSVELCGGTHITNTSEIRLFKFVSEGSVAAGVRRVEALTAGHAYLYLDDKATRLDQVASLLKATGDPLKAVEDLVAKQKDLEKQLQQLNSEKISRLKDTLLTKLKPHQEIQLLCEQVPLDSADHLKQLSFELRQATSHALIVLGAEVDGKALLSVIMSEDLAQTKQYHAGNLVRELAKEVKGGGGGQPFYATAGGKDPEGLPRALAKVTALLEA